MKKSTLAFYLLQPDDCYLKLMELLKNWNCFKNTLLLARKPYIQNYFYIYRCVVSQSK